MLQPEPQPRAWPSLFADAIRHAGPELSLMLDVSDCRERWLQGEMFLYLRRFDPAFEISRASAGFNSKADFYGESPRPMIAELKLLGSGYAMKCFDGTGAIAECFTSAAAGARVPVTEEHLTRACGYFLHDVNRMRVAEGDYERYVILVVDQRPPLNPLGKALLAIQIGQDELTVESPRGDWIARIWTVNG